jgi:hypothetical protein
MERDLCRILNWRLILQPGEYTILLKSLSMRYHYPNLASWVGWEMDLQMTPNSVDDNNGEYSNVQKLHLTSPTLLSQIQPISESHSLAGYYHLLLWVAVASFVLKSRTTTLRIFHT